MQKQKDERRERGKNFTEKEREMAVAIIDRYRPIFENKLSDGTSLKAKKEAWQNIAEEYNATALSAPRTAQQLKILWSNLRRTAKKTIAEDNKKRYLDNEDDLIENMEDLKKKKIQDKINMSKTGGGKYNAQLTEVDARVLAMIEEEARPLSNVYDDDNIYHGDVTLSPSRGMIEITPVPSPTPLRQPNSPEAVAGPSRIHTLSIENPVPEVQNPHDPLPPKKFILPRRKMRHPKKTKAQLKRLFYLKKIQLANMDIRFKKKMYDLELKIKQNELNKSISM